MYRQTKDSDGRFGCLYETVFSLCPTARSIFDQLCNLTSKKASRQRVDSGAVCLFRGLHDSKITGMDMSHLLLLLPFLLPVFDLLQDTVAKHNNLHGAAHVSPAHDLIDWDLVLLEWYRLYR